MVHFGFHQQMARHCHLHHVVVRHRHVVGVDSVSYGRPIRRPAPNCFVFFVSQVAQIFVFVTKKQVEKEKFTLRLGSWLRLFRGGGSGGGSNLYPGRTGRRCLFNNNLLSPVANSLC